VPPVRPTHETDDVIITQAIEAADVAEVRALFLEYAASLGVDLGYQGFHEEVASLPGVYALPRGCLLLARRDARSLACAGVRPIDADVCEIKRLYVRPEERGLGAGRALTLATIAFARSVGFTAMRLDTLPTMRSAQALYRDLGFREIAPYRHSPVAGNLYMELTLSPGDPPP
jgi:putative acetyltransferase